MLVLAIAALLGASDPNDVPREAAEAARARAECAPEVIRAIDYGRLSRDYEWWRLTALGRRQDPDRLAAEAVLRAEGLGGDWCSTAASSYRQAQPGGAEGNDQRARSVSQRAER